MKNKLKKWISVLLVLTLLIGPLAIADENEAQPGIVDQTVSDTAIDAAAGSSVDDSDPSANEASTSAGEGSIQSDEDTLLDGGDVISASDVDPSVGEIGEVDLTDLDGNDGDEPSGTDPIGDTQDIPFDQIVEIGDVSIRVTAGAKSFPEGSTLWADRATDEDIIQAVDAALELNGEYAHCLYRIEVRDASDNAILPFEGFDQPIVRIEGLNASNDTRVACYDSVTETAFEVDAAITDGAVEFAFVDLAIYDFIVPQISEDSSVKEQPTTEEPAVDEPSDNDQGEDASSKDGQTENSEDQIEDGKAAEQPEGDQAENGEDGSSDKKKPISPEDEQNAEDQPDTEKDDNSDEDEGGWMKTHVDKADEGAELDVLYEGESAKLMQADSLQAAEYVSLPSILYVGDVYDLKKCLLLAEYSPSEVVSWKSSKSKVLRIKNGMLTALKPGRAKITVKTKDGTKRKLSLSVSANNIGGLFSKPSKSDAVALGNAFSIRPKSLKYSGTKLVAEFYLLNGSKKTISKIRDLNLSIFVGGRTNKIASQYFSKVRVKGKKKGVSTFKVTFSSGVLQNNIHLSDYSANNIYFDLDTSSIYGKAVKKTIPFVATVIPNVPAPVTVSGIVLSNNELYLSVGKTTSLTATVLPDNAENKGIIWSSNNPGVATVNGDGLVTAVSEGEATISAIAADGSGVSASCVVKVANENIQVTSIEFNQIPTVTVGQTATITATLSPVNVSNSQLEYKLTKSGIVELTQEPTTSGNKTTFNIRALSEGSTKLSVRTTDGSNLSASCTIYVVDPEFRFIVNNESNTILSTGDTSGSTSIVSGATNKYKYTLNIDSSHSWSVSASDTSWMTLNKATGSAGQSDLVLTLKNISSGPKYSTILTFTVNGTTRDLTVKLNKSDKLDKAVITDICRPAYNTVRLEWTGVDNAEGFKVWRRKGDDMGYIATLSASQLYYEDTGLPNGKYRYSITAYKGATESDSDEKTIIVYSANDEIIPAPSVTVSNAGSGALTISWNKTKDYYGDEVTSYKAYRSTSQNGPYKLIKTLNGYNSNTFTDSGLTNGTKYYYRVAALSSGASQSVLSTAVSGTPSGSASPTVPDAPTNVSATAQSSSSILVTWKKSNSSNVKGYKVYYGTNSSSGSATWFNNKTYDSNTTSATITGLSSGTKYYVWVKATSSAGDSAFSSSDYDTTLTKPAVTSFTVTHSSLSNNVLTMNSDAGQGHYCTLKVKSNKAWTATLTNDTSGFVKFTSTGSTATINSETSASGAANTELDLRVEIKTTPQAGTTSQATLKFSVDGQNYTYTIKCTRDVPSGSVSLTVRSDSSSGSVISNKDIIKWPIGKTFTVACSQTNGNGKYLVKSYVTSQMPSFKESDVSNLVTGIAYQGTGYYYGKNGNDEFGQSIMNALSFDCVGLSEGQYVKIWIGAEDQYYSSNGVVNGIQFALEMTKDNVNYGNTEITSVKLLSNEVVSGGRLGVVVHYKNAQHIRINVNNTSSYIERPNQNYSWYAPRVSEGFVNCSVPIPSNMSGSASITIWISNQANAIDYSKDPHITKSFTVKSVQNVGDNYKWPLNGKFQISSLFGERDIGSTGSTNHRGIDIACTKGTPVLAAASGTIDYAGWMAGYGYYVRIWHNNSKIYSFYGHLDSIPDGINAGIQVNQGDVIGISGNTGGKYEYHLHFGMSGSKNAGLNNDNDPIDPLSVMIVSGQEATFGMGGVNIYPN